MVNASSHQISAFPSTIAVWTLWRRLGALMGLVSHQHKSVHHINRIATLTTPLDVQTECAPLVITNHASQMIMAAHPNSPPGAKRMASAWGRFLPTLVIVHSISWQSYRLIQPHRTFVKLLESLLATVEITWFTVLIRSVAAIWTQIIAQ